MAARVAAVVHDPPVRLPSLFSLSADVHRLLRQASLQEMRERTEDATAGLDQSARKLCPTRRFGFRGTGEPPGLRHVNRKPQPPTGKARENIVCDGGRRTSPPGSYRRLRISGFGSALRGARLVHFLPRRRGDETVSVLFHQRRRHSWQLRAAGGRARRGRNFKGRGDAQFAVFGIGS